MSHSGTIRFHQRYRQEILIAVLVIFYTVGISGILLPESREEFLKLSPMNLLLSFGILILSRKTKRQLFLVFLFICFLTGMAVEWIGIHTGWLFGDYAYDTNLGTKLGGVPLIIGVNWGILSACCCAVASYAARSSRTKLPVAVLSLLSAFLMMLLDVLIEPVAIASNYWYWNSEDIPAFNYICWFAIAFPLHFVYFRWKLNEQNKVSIALFIIMVVFFTVLNFR